MKIFMGKLIYFFLFFVLFHGRVWSAEGCYVSGNTGMIGTVTSKSGSFDRDYTFNYTNTFYMDCPMPLNAANLRVESYTPVSVNTICSFLGCLTTPARCKLPSSSSTFNGFVYNFNLVPCPLDDYIWSLIIPLGCLSIYNMRK